MYINDEQIPDIIRQWQTHTSIYVVKITHLNLLCYLIQVRILSLCSSALNDLVLCLSKSNLLTDVCPSFVLIVGDPIGDADIRDADMGDADMCAEEVVGDPTGDDVTSSNVEDLGLLIYLKHNNYIYV